MVRFQIGKENIQLKDRLNVGLFKMILPSLGKLQSEEGSELDKLIPIMDILEVCGVKNMDDYDVNDIFLLMNDSKFAEWMTNLMSGIAPDNMGKKD